MDDNLFFGACQPSDFREEAPPVDNSALFGLSESEEGDISGESDVVAQDNSDDDQDVQWLEADEDPAADTVPVEAPVLPLISTRRRKRAPGTPKSKSPVNSGGSDEGGRDNESEDDDDSDGSFRPTKRARRLTHAASGEGKQPPLASTSPTPAASRQSLPRSSAAASDNGARRGPKAWSRQSEVSCMDHMRDVMAEGTIQGEDRFREVQRRMQKAGHPRAYTGIKNMWNRKLRKESGLDERRKKTHPLATSKQDKATKDARKQKKEAERARKAQTKPTGTAPKQSRTRSSMANNKDDSEGEGDAVDDQEKATTGEEQSGPEDKEDSVNEQDEPETIACICNGSNDNDACIECSNGERCVGARWYHLSCVGLDQPPQEDDDTWYCPFCDGPVED